MKTALQTATEKTSRLEAIAQFKEGDRVYNRLRKVHGYYHSPNLGQSMPSCWVDQEAIRDDQLFIEKFVPTDPLDLELCASSHCSQEWQAGSVVANSPDLATNSEPPSSLNGTPIASKCLEGTSQESQYTETCEPLKELGEALTELPLPLPASLSPTPDLEKVEMISEICSPNFSDCFAEFDQDGRLLKMCQGFSQLTLQGTSEEYSGNLPRWGTMSNGKLYHAPKWVESTGEKESGFLPTPTASDATTGQIIGKNDTFKETKNGTLRKHSQTQSSAEGGLPPQSFAGSNGSLGLGRYVQMLPTPKAQDGIHPGVTNCKPGQTTHLSAAVMGDGLGKKKLSPNFVEKMMSFPQDWTALQEASVTTLCDTPTSPNGYISLPTPTTSPIEKNDSKPWEIASLVTLPRSPGQESQPLPAEPWVETDQWGTPDSESQPILTLVKQLLGGEIDLDPTSNHNQRTGATRHFTQADNCLDKDWTSSGVFMNPPFSKPFPFVEKLCTEYKKGHFESAIALLKLGCVSNKGTGGLISQYASAICFWRSPRIRFTKNGEQSNATPDFDSVLVYFGQNPQLFDQLFSPYGTISILKVDPVPTLKELPIQVINEELGVGLTYDEERDFAHLERKVERAFIKAELVFRDAVFALKEIRDRKLYRNTCPTFEEYCKVRFGFSRRRPYQLIDAAVVLENLENLDLQMCTKTEIGTHLLPTNERQIRDLVDLSPEEQVTVWGKAVHGGKIPSGEKIKDTLDAHIRERLNQPPIPTYIEGDVVEIRSGGSSTLRDHDGMWGIVTDVLPSRYKVYISLRDVELRCKGDEMSKVDDKYTADILLVSDRVKRLKECSLDAAEYAVLQVIAKNTCFSPKQMALLEFLEGQYGI